MIRVGKRLVVTESFAVKTKDVRSRLLILQLEKESVRDIDASRVQADNVSVSAGRWIVGGVARDLIRPVVPATRVGVTAEKIVVMLLHEKARLVKRVRSRWTKVVIKDCYRGHVA